MKRIVKDDDVLDALRRIGDSDGWVAPASMRSELGITSTQTRGIFYRLNLKGLVEGNHKRGLGSRWRIAGAEKSAPRPQAKSSLSSVPDEDLVQEARICQARLKDISVELLRRWNLLSAFVPALRGKPAVSNRKSNAKSKDLLVTFFKEHANESFSIPQMVDLLPRIVPDILRRQVSYLHSTGFLHKTGDRYNLKIDETKKGRAKNADVARRQTQILNIVGAKPVTQVELRGLLRCDWNRMQKALKGLRRDGLLKEVTIKGQSSNGRSISSTKLALAN